MAFSLSKRAIASSERRFLLRAFSAFGAVSNPSSFISSRSHPLTAAPSTLSTIARFKSTLSSPPSTPGKAPKETAQFKLVPEEHVGCVALTPFNVQSVLSSPTPTIVYFYINAHPQIAAFSKLVCDSVEAANKRHKSTANSASDAASKKSATDSLAIQLATVDCAREMQLAMQFGIQPEQIPSCFFIYNSQCIDRMVGVVDDAATMDNVIDRFLEFVAGDKKGKTETTDSNASQEVSTAESEQVETANDGVSSEAVLNEGHKLRESGDLAGAILKYEEAARVAHEKVQELKIKLHIEKKKLTPELLSKLKADPNYYIVARALAGQAVCKLESGELDRAAALAAEIRESFPNAIEDRKDVAGTIVKAEILALLKCQNIEKVYEGNSHHSNSSTKAMPVKSVKDYTDAVRLAAGLFIVDGNGDKAVEQCLELIRAEPRLLKDLKKEGIVAADTNLSSPGATIARKLTLLIFEGLGRNNKCVVEARKKLRAYFSL